MKIILYHNHNCSKSRECYELLKKNDVNFELRNYIKSPLKLNEILEIISNLGHKTEEIVRNQKDFDLNLIKSKSELSKLIYENQKILQRPILFYKKYWVCRPPEKALEILGV